MKIKSGTIVEQTLTNAAKAANQGKATYLGEVVVDNASYALLIPPHVSVDEETGEETVEDIAVTFGSTARLNRNELKIGGNVSLAFKKTKADGTPDEEGALQLKAFGAARALSNMEHTSRYFISLKEGFAAAVQPIQNNLMNKGTEEAMKEAGLLALNPVSKLQPAQIKAIIEETNLRYFPVENGDTWDFSKVDRTTEELVGSRSTVVDLELVCVPIVDGRLQWNAAKLCHHSLASKTKINGLVKFVKENLDSNFLTTVAKYDIVPVSLDTHITSTVQNAKQAVSKFEVKHLSPNPLDIKLSDFQGDEVAFKNALKSLEAGVKKVTGLLSQDMDELWERSPISSISTKPTDLLAAMLGKVATSSTNIGSALILISQLMELEDAEEYLKMLPQNYARRLASGLTLNTEGLNVKIPKAIPEAYTEKAVLILEDLGVDLGDISEESAEAGGDSFGTTSAKALENLEVATTATDESIVDDIIAEQENSLDNTLKSLGIDSTPTANAQTETTPEVAESNPPITEATVGWTTEDSSTTI